VIRGLLFVLQLLVWLLVVRLLVRSVARLFAPGAARPRPAPPRPAARPVEDLVLDRVCRTHLPRSRALTARVGGREEHFCSATCRDKALAAEARAS
jgi:hypothetical protein